MKIYLPVALASSLVATTGADLAARTIIAGEPFEVALGEHLHDAAVQFAGTLFLLAPFVIVGFLCALAEKRARSRGVAFIFAAAMLILLYFYFDAYQGAQHALLEEKWTAAALSIGLLPFFVGIPVVLFVLGMIAVAAKFDPRTSR